MIRNLTLILFFLSHLNLCQDEPKNNYRKQEDKYCSDFNESHFDLTPEQRQKKRDKYETGMSIDFEKVKKAIDDGKYGDVLSDVAFGFTIIILMLIVSFFSIVFFIVTCCCAKKANKSASQKLYLYITLGVLVAFAAFFWTMVGFIASIDQEYKQVNCVIAKLPNDILNGTTKEYQFIGLF